MHFRNQNFVNQLAKLCGIDYQLDCDTTKSILFIVENLTRRLIEKAIIYKRQFKVSKITIQHLDYAASDLQLQVSTLLSNKQQHMIKHQNCYIRRNDMIQNLENYITHQINYLNKLEKYQISGRWIYLDGKVTAIEENSNVKTIKDIIQMKQKQKIEKQNKFNIIKDKPLSLLTKEQEQYFNQVINSDNVQKYSFSLKHNILPLLPFFLNYILSSPPSSHSFYIISSLIDNVYVNQRLQYWGHQVLAYLLSYPGQEVFKAGIYLGILVSKWQTKYPQLREVGCLIKGYKDGAGWHGQTKKLGWALIKGQYVDVENLKKCLLKGNKQAQIFSRILKQCIGKIPYKQQYQDFLQDGLVGLMDDIYGQVFI